MLSNWSGYVPTTQNQAFDVAFSPEKLTLTKSNVSQNNQTNLNKNSVISELYSLVPNLKLSSFYNSKINIYNSLQDYFSKNTLKFNFNPIFANFPESEFISSDSVSSRPLFELFSDELYLINVQGNILKTRNKYDFGKTIITNYEDAKKLALSLAEYYMLNNFDVGVILKPISYFQALDMVLSNFSSNDFTLYYKSLSEFLSNKNYPDFKLLINENLKNLQYLISDDFKSNLNSQSKHFYEPVIKQNHHKKQSNLVTFSNYKEAEKYLAAYLSATSESASKTESKINDMEIFGNINGLDLHNLMLEDISFDSVDDYINFVENLKHSRPFDTDITTFNKIKEIVKQENFGE